MFLTLSYLLSILDPSPTFPGVLDGLMSPNACLLCLSHPQLYPYQLHSILRFFETYMVLSIEFHYAFNYILNTWNEHKRTKRDNVAHLIQ